MNLAALIILIATLKLLIFVIEHVKRVDDAERKRQRMMQIKGMQSSAMFLYAISKVSSNANRAILEAKKREEEVKEAKKRLNEVFKRAELSVEEMGKSFKMVSKAMRGINIKDIER